jgi:1-aminocyclopropane-1-carboxylate deaminase/D-cysteine desulfhydrase-like pyridoxal-dependent ACC family enzyme
MQGIRGATRELELRLPSPVEELTDERLTARGIRLYVKRDNLIHLEIPGNKWRKLHLNLDAASRSDHRTVLTFGGAYNHIQATARPAPCSDWPPSESSAARSTFR